METKNDIKRFFSKYLNGEHSKEELAILLDYFSIEEESETLIELISLEFEKPLPLDIDQHIVDDINERVRTKLMQNIKPKVKTMDFLKVAASIILLLGVLSLFYYNSDLFINQNVIQTEQIADIRPGTNKATLQLDGAERIELSEDKEGILTGEQITYDDGTIIETPKAQFATLSTPNGGQYQITLPDGTKVWLNAASSLRYPTEFKNKERKVELIGEAFFEVAHDPDLPFIVETNRQHVKVLGTTFNLYAYHTEKSIITTLVQGSVLLSYSDGSDLLKTQQLLPGQQSVLHDNGMQVKKVEVDQYISWKDGTFMLSNADLSSFAQQIERWYDVEMIIYPSLQDVRLSGVFSRKANLSELLEAISENENIKFKLEGRRISMRK